MSNKGNKDAFCLMPWIHLYLAQNGKINACCNAPIQYGNGNKDNLKLLFKKEVVNHFKNNLLNGVKDNRCKLCYEQEKAGKESIRTETLLKYKHYWSFDDSTQSYSLKSPPNFPVYFDIRFSNVCNLKCRTCWHGNSSSWFEDAKQIGNAIGEKAILKATEKNYELIDQIIDNSEGIEEIYFAGGEPLMMDEHYYFLEQLLEKKAQPLLRYNTNLSRFHLKDKNALNYWKQFKNVEILVSIDQMNQKFEYVRKNANWQQTVENLVQLKEHTNIKLDIAPTVSVFNILDLGEMHSYFAEHLELDWDAIYFNLMQRPDFYSIQSLDKRIKEIATEKLEAYIKKIKNLANKRVIEELRSIVVFMNQKDIDRKKAFNKYNGKLDQLRNEDFHSIFPELK